VRCSAAGSAAAPTSSSVIGPTRVIAAGFEPKPVPAELAVR